MCTMSCTHRKKCLKLLLVQLGAVNYNEIIHLKLVNDNQSFRSCAPVLKGMNGLIWASVVGTKHDCEMEVNCPVGTIAQEGLDLSAFRIEPGVKMTGINKSDSLI